MKISKRSRWFIPLVVLAASVIVLLTQADEVKATINGLHAFKVYVRVQTEIMQTTPAGRHYESLFWKHNDELMQIIFTHPGHKESFLNVLLKFVPELEALLNGDGDKAFITSEHVEIVKSELDWYVSVGSPSLRDDIERERQRLPLDALVGLSMKEALDFINSQISPDHVPANTLVPGSDGKWAYYLHDGLYIEYPASYSVQVSASEDGYIYFIPFNESPVSWNPCVVKIRVWNVPPDEKDAHSPRTWYRPESIVWENVVQTPQFPGIEFVSFSPNAQYADFHAYQYNDEKQLAVDIWVFVFHDPELSETSSYSDLIAQRYEYFQHMVDSLRIQ